MKKRVTLPVGLIVIALFAGCVVMAQSPTGKKIQVIVFLGPDCPISQDYVGVLNKIQQQYPQVKITGILPAANNHDKKLFKKEYQVAFVLKADNRKRAVKRFNTTATPEAILLDDASHVCYQGAIDNWYFELGRHRPQPTEHYLVNAIEDILAGRQVKVSRTEAIGCIISRVK